MPAAFHSCGVLHAAHADVALLLCFVVPWTAAAFLLLLLLCCLRLCGCRWLLLLWLAVLLQCSF